MAVPQTAPSAEFQNAGKPVAQPAYLVDQNGNPITSSNGLPISGTIMATEASVGVDGSPIPLSSTMVGASDGTNLQQLLVESSTNRNLRTALYSGATEATITGANALKVDGSAVTQPANVTQIGGTATQMSQDDGASLNALLELALMAYSSGGPVLANGTPSQLTWDRIRSWLGKASQTNAITSTTAGDTALTFSVAPKTITPGQAIKLSGAASPEYVYVADSFVVSASATSVALKSPVVNTGQTSASWSVFSTAGPGSGAVLPEGVGVQIPLVFDNNTGNLYAAQASSLDAVNGRSLPEFVPGLYNGSTTDRWRSDGTGLGKVSLYVKKTTAGDTVLALGSATGANSIPVVLASDQADIKVQLDVITAALSQTNQIPVSNAGQQGQLTIAGTLTANSDNSLTFSGNATVARRIRIQNESAGTIYWSLDATASTGSPSIAAPLANSVAVEWISMACTTLHIWIPTGGTTTLNGLNGVKVTAWA